MVRSRVARVLVLAAAVTCPVLSAPAAHADVGTGALASIIRAHVGCSDPVIFIADVRCDRVPGVVAGRLSRRGAWSPGSSGRWGRG
jgi:hypothetical protein